MGGCCTVAALAQVASRMVFHPPGLLNQGLIRFPAHSMQSLQSCQLLGMNDSYTTQVRSSIAGASECKMPVA
jgi:hypothetical protein